MNLKEHIEKLELMRTLARELGMPMIECRRLYEEADPDGYLESDDDFVHNNMNAAVWLLEKMQ